MADPSVATPEAVLMTRADYNAQQTYITALETVEKAARRRLQVWTRDTYMELSRALYAADHARWMLERGESDGRK